MQEPRHEEAQVRPREEKKLDRLLRQGRSLKELADLVSSSSSSTAALFSSEYHPMSEWGVDPRPPGQR